MWIFGGSVIAIPTYLLMWVVPDTTAGGKLAYYLAIYTVKSLSVTALALGLRTLIMYMSDDSGERDSAVGYRVAFETGGVVVGIGMQGLIVGALGGSLSSSACANITVSNSSGVDVDMGILQAQRTGYLVAGGSVCACCVLAAMAALLGVTERKDTMVDISTLNEPVLKTLRVMFTFKPFLYGSGIAICYDITTSVSLPYLYLPRTIPK
ncbi:sodium-dependent lysophosphatidylcholine symporter 1-like [Branchiostoma lanceolatum]|uniref:sodium-dependent lysophosphatidylcholine symporter 1-like n=1 Tax=Branchiostoma lanceolatum TaxID=7740 RepID=UPI003451773A